ncbi:hypothetical protein V492_01607 [Pseudogymnoascus sp. VKM F-4246]|nr:hypothetical protein V492_01607 [Pseudogymnoascus sp. VKM F-4246]
MSSEAPEGNKRKDAPASSIPEAKIAKNGEASDNEDANLGDGMTMKTIHPKTEQQEPEIGDSRSCNDSNNSSSTDDDTTTTTTTTTTAFTDAKQASIYLRCIPHSIKNEIKIQYLQYCRRIRPPALSTAQFSYLHNSPI